MALSAQDLLTSNTAYRRYGFKNPNNNIGAMANRLSLPFFEQAAQGAVFANELEPQRQGAIRALVNSSNPANMVANAQSHGGRIYNQAQSQGTRGAAMLAQFGGGKGAQLGAIAGAQNAGTEAANQLLLNAYSPQAQNQALVAILNAINQAPGGGIESLLNLAGPVTQKEHDRMARQQGQGFGGVLGSLVGMGLGGGIPGFDFTSLFGGGGSPNPAVSSAAHTAASSIWDLL